MPSSITARSPSRFICSSRSWRHFSTVSSMRAGWIDVYKRQGQGYPKERVVPEQRNKKILDGVRAATFKPLIECLKRCV